LPREEAKEIVAYLAKYEPFSKQHIVWALLAETGIRQSTLYAFDLDDYDSEERYIEVVNREETGTRLKTVRQANAKSVFRATQRKHLMAISKPNETM